MTGFLGSGGQPLVASHDVLLLDLDGVVYTGPRAVHGAVPALLEVVRRGARLAYVTNNASRTPQVVADQLVGLGLPASADHVVTSADAAAEHLAVLLPAGAPVLVVGGPGLVEAVAREGLRPVGCADDGPAAVVQGFGPEVGWSLLAEAAYALAAGIPWVATNRDLTFPTGRGLAPGNGTFVVALELTTGRAPVTVGKPEPGLFRSAVGRTVAARPLVVGDRLDTDIVGARRAGLASVLVLTGVTTVPDLLAAAPAERPDHVVADLSGLLAVHPAVLSSEVGAGTGPGTECGGWRAEVVDNRLLLDGAGESMDALRCAATATWAVADAGGTVVSDDVAALLTERLHLRR